MIISTIGFIFIANTIGSTEYGKLSAGLSFIALFSLLTLGQMSKVLIRTGSKQLSSMVEFYNNTFGFKTVVTLGAMIVACIFLLISPYDSNMKLLILILLPNLVYYGFESYLSAPLMVTEKMHFIAIIQILNKFSFVLFAFLLIKIGAGIKALAIITIIIDISIILIYFLIALRIINKPIRIIFKIDWAIIKPTLIFSILLFSGFIATRTDILMISFLRPFDDVGTYQVVTNLIEPLSVLKNLLSVSFFPLIVKLFHNNKPSGKKIIYYSGFLGVVALIGALILSLFSGTIIDLFFPTYQDAKPIFSVLVFYQTIGFITLPFSLFLQATDNEMSLLKVSWIPPLANVFLNLIFLEYFGLIGIAYSTLVVYIVYLCLNIYLTYVKIFKKV